MPVPGLPARSLKVILVKPGKSSSRRVHVHTWLRNTIE